METLLQGHVRCSVVWYRWISMETLLQGHVRCSVVWYRWISMETLLQGHVRCSVVWYRWIFCSLEHCSGGHARCSVVFGTDFKLKTPDRKVHGANMGPTWVLSIPGGPHVGPMNLAIWVLLWGNVRCSVVCYKGFSDEHCTEGSRTLFSIKVVFKVNTCSRATCIT